MEASCKSLIIPCELPVREFDAKLLLSCVAVERGFRVFLGAKGEINMWATRLPRSIYLQKSLTKRSYRMFDIIDRIGHPIVSTDEEGLIYFSRGWYQRLKMHPPTIRKARALLAWGPENAETWRSHPEFPGIPIALTGNPRVDMLRPELRSYFDDEVAKIRARIGRFVLINTNFGYVNHYFPKMGARYLIQSAQAALGADHDGGSAAQAHSSEIFRAFREMLPALARRFPDFTFVVRPHPSESHEVWQQAAAGLDNARVIHEGNVVPWLIAAEALIHNGCTTAFESYLLGTPAITYRPVESEQFDLHLPNALSYASNDLGGVIELVDAALRGSMPDDRAHSERRQALIDQHIAPRTGPLASEQITDVLEMLEAECRGEQASTAWRRATARLHGVVRNAEKRLAAFLPQHNNNRDYVKHVCSDIFLEDIETGITRLQNTLGRFADVRVRPVAPQVFELAPGPKA